MPQHKMFTTDAKEALNYAVNAGWIIALPCVIGKFGHDQKKAFHATMTTNEKRGTDGHVLGQLLLHYVNVKTLHPDALDIPGKENILAHH
jgi:hypothetical protein